MELLYVSFFKTHIFFLSETGTDTCVLNWQLLVPDNFIPHTNTNQRIRNIWFYLVIYCNFLTIFFMCLYHGLLWDFNYCSMHIKCPAFLLWVWHFVPIFMFICVFQASRHLQKEGRQKHLFTPLLSRRDLEGGSVLSTAILLNGPWFTQVHSQLVQGCVFVSICDRKEDDRELFGCEGSRRGVEIAHFNEDELQFAAFIMTWSVWSLWLCCSVCHLWVHQPRDTFSGSVEDCNPITLHG